MTLAAVIGFIAVTSAGAGGTGSLSERGLVSGSKAEGFTPIGAAAKSSRVAPRSESVDYVPRKAYLYVKKLAAKRLRLLGVRERRIVRLLKEVRHRRGARHNGQTNSTGVSGGVRGAICTVFGAHCSEALNVARCESGFNVYARNGQYLGLFQMGSFARAKYGHSWNAWGQSRSAYRYFLDAGWSPWACRP